MGRKFQSFLLLFFLFVEEVIQKIAGNGVAGYADGELGSAMFNKPKSFAVDFKGNLYVADKFNYTIRKISKSGVCSLYELFC